MSVRQRHVVTSFVTLVLIMALAVLFPASLAIGPSIAAAQEASDDVIVLSPIADTSWQSDPTGTDEWLRVSNYNTALVKYDLSGVDEVYAATARIYNTDGFDAVPHALTIYAAKSEDWDEDDWFSDYSSQPDMWAMIGETLGQKHVTPPAGYVEFDVTEHVQNRLSEGTIHTITFGYLHEGGPWQWYHSREHATHQPELVISTVEVEPPPPPLAPENLEVTAGVRHVTLSWSESVDALSYNVKRSETTGGPYDVIAEGVLAPGYIDGGLDADTTYYYVVSAVNAGGESDHSAEVSVVPLPFIPGTSEMKLGTNFWNFAWGTGRADYFIDGIDWSDVDNPWRQRFLDEVSIYSVIRFMDQVPTNHSNVRYWSERVPKHANHYNTNNGAVAYEWQIDLANRVGADIWITVPHLTIENYEESPEDNYWTELAKLIKELLDPDLNVYVEYSNETWNGGFGQGQYAAQRGVDMGFDPDGYTASFMFHTYAAVRLHDVFLDVFSDEPERVKTVVASQSHWGTTRILVALNDPNINPWVRTPEYLAIGGYFSPGKNGGAQDIRGLWSAEIADLPNSEYPEHLASSIDAGMKLIIYEGGQHYTTNAHIFSQNPESYDMYMEWLDAMQEYVELLVHYTHVGSWASGGSWGAKHSTDQPVEEAHRYRALRDWVLGVETEIADLLLSGDKSVDEGLPAGTLVGTLSTNRINDEGFLYELVGGDTDSFAIDGNELLTAEVFDHAAKDSYEIVIRVTDPDAPAYSLERTFTIQVNKVIDGDVIVLNPIADTSWQSDPDGTYPLLAISAYNNALIKYDISQLGGVIRSAYARIYLPDGDVATPHELTIYAAQSEDWQEDDWFDENNSEPDMWAMIGETLGQQQVTPPVGYVEFDVTEFVQSRLTEGITSTITFGYTANDGAPWQWYHSRENEQFPPELVITVGEQPEPGVPATPTDLEAVAGDGEVRLTWSASAGATGYHVKRSETEGGPYDTIAAEVTETSYTDEDVVNETTYYYVVSAVNAVGQSADSDELSATPQVQPIDEIIVLSPIADTTYQADEHGTDTILRISTYNQALIKYDLAELDGVGEILSATARIYNTDGRDAAPHDLIIYVANSEDWQEDGWYDQNEPEPDLWGMIGDDIDQQSVVPPAGYVEFDVTEALLNRLSDGTESTITFGYYTSDGTGWQWYHSRENEHFPPELVITLGEQPEPGVPATPTDLEAVAGDGEVSLTWSASAGATSYHVKRSETEGGPYDTIAAEVTETSYTDEDVVNETTYYYVVSAVNAVGQSADSDEVSATPQVQPIDEIIVLNPIADTDWQADETGSSGVLRVSAHNHMLVKYDLSGVDEVYAATARIYNTDGFDAAPHDLIIYAALSENWQEDHWHDGLGVQPDLWSMIGPTLAQRHVVPPGGYVEFDVTDFVQSRLSQGAETTITFGYQTNDGPGWQWYHSRENEEFPPELVISTVEVEPPAPPLAPENLEATAGVRHVTLTWSQSAGALSYKVKRSEASGGPYDVIAEGVLATKYVDGGLDADTTYYYVVSAVNAGGESDHSAEVSVVPLPFIPGTSEMKLGTNFWNFGWGTGRADYFIDGIDWSDVDNPWRQRFLDEVSIYSVMRFMDQVPTNSSEVRYWHERVPKDANHYNTHHGAVAYEWQIDLANRVGADIWITVPHLTIENYEESPEDNYWTELAKLIKEQLDPDLNVYVEYSNETWNTAPGFGQGQYAAQRGVDMGFDPDGYTASFMFHTYAAVRLHDVFLDVFSDEPERVKTVVASQSHWGTTKIMDALSDQDINPFGRIPEYLAIGGYFSAGGDGGAQNVRGLWSAALADLPNSEYPKHLASSIDAGMKLIIYEGGQHYTTNAHIFSQNPESYDMYMEWLVAMQDYVELLVHYTHVGTWASGGAWGAKHSTDQPVEEAHRYRALRDWVLGVETEIVDLLLSGDRTVDEGLPAGMLVGTLSTNRINDEGFLYELVGGDTGSFAIDGNELLTAEVFDHAAKDSYEIVIKVTDPDAPVYSLERTFTIHVNKVVDGDVIVLSPIADTDWQADSDGTAPLLRISDYNHVLVKYDLTELDGVGEILSATARLYNTDGFDAAPHDVIIYVANSEDWEEDDWYDPYNSQPDLWAMIGAPLGEQSVSPPAGYVEFDVTEALLNRLSEGTESTITFGYQTAGGPWQWYHSRENSHYPPELVLIVGEASEPGAPEVPDAMFHFTPDNPHTVGETITFVDQTADPDEIITGRRWDLGDGTIVLDETTVEHSYTVPGVYHVSLVLLFGEEQGVPHREVIVVGGTEAPVESWVSQEVEPDGELDASDEVGITLTVSGTESVTVTTASFADNPVPEVGQVFQADGSFFDINLDRPEVIDSIEFTWAFDATVDPEDLIMMWFDEDDHVWRLVVSQVVEASPGGGGVIRVNLDGDSSPRVDQLTGTIFGAGASAAPIVTILAPTGHDVWTAIHMIRWEAVDSVDDDALTIDLAFAPAGTENWKAIATDLENDGSHMWDVSSVTPGGLYVVRVQATNAADAVGSAESQPFTIAQAGSSVQHGPNPADMTVTFYFDGDTSGTLYVYDSTGRLVWTRQLASGDTHLEWDLTHTNGRPLANGLYLYRVVWSDGDRSETGRLVIVR